MFLDTRISVMKRILVVIQTPTFGGPHNQMSRSAEALRARGWELSALLPDEADSRARECFADAGCRVFTTRINRLRKSLNPKLHWEFLTRFRSQTRAMAELMKKEQIDLVQVCGLMTLQPAFAAKRAGLPVVWQMLSLFAPMPLRGWLTKVVIKRADVAMTTGMEVARKHPGLVEHFGERLIPFFAPVDTDSFRLTPEKRAEARAEMGVPRDAIVIGSVGNQNWQKGHDYFVRAAAMVAEKCENVYFRIYGQKTAANASFYKKEVVEWADRKGLFENGRLAIQEPPLPIATLLTGMDIFTLSSRTEGTPTALMEAMSVELPSVATRVGSVGEIIRDGEDGLLVEAGDSEALASAWLKLIEDDGMRRAFAARAREAAVTTFDTRFCAERHSAAYEAALSRLPGISRDESEV